MKEITRYSVWKTLEKAREKLFQKRKSILLYNFFAQMTLFSVSLFGLHITATWYGLMYAIGFIVCYEYVKRLGYVRRWDMDSLLLYIFIGVVGWWRLGYILLYDLPYFLAHPLDIFTLWKWGMSFHGGAIWVILMILLFAHKYRYAIFDISDPLVAILPIALGLGRIGNYLNNELLGYTPYSWPFAMISQWVAHFPSPLFQVFLEGIVLLTIMQIYRIYEKRTSRAPGYASALFLIGYGILRIFAEYFRLPDAHIGYLFGTEWITLGMMYSIPMILLGIWIYRRASIISRKKN